MCLTDGVNVYGSRGGEFKGTESVYRLKVVISCSWGHFLFTCSDSVCDVVHFD